jgi:hypothetical protein
LTWSTENGVDWNEIRSGLKRRLTVALTFCESALGIPCRHDGGGYESRSDETPAKLTSSRDRDRDRVKCLINIGATRVASQPTTHGGLALTLRKHAHRPKQPPRSARTYRTDRRRYHCSWRKSWYNPLTRVRSIQVFLLWDHTEVSQAEPVAHRRPSSSNRKSTPRSRSPRQASDSFCSLPCTNFRSYQETRARYVSLPSLPSWPKKKQRWRWTRPRTPLTNLA